MIEHSKTIIELAVFYTCVVAILDFFLTKFPIVDWLALILSFIFFTGLLLGPVWKLLAKGRNAPTIIPRKHEDELARLERTVQRSMIERQPESIKMLEERLRSIVATALTRQTIGPSTHLLKPGTNDPHSLALTLEDHEFTSLLAECSAAVNNANLQGVERVLTKIESWLI